VAGAGALSDAARALLAADPAWGAYLLADLEPPLDAHARWFVASDALVLLYDAFGTPLYTPFGPATACAPLFAQAVAVAPPAPRAFVACALDHRAYVEQHVRFDGEPSAMFRMRLDRARFADPGASAAPLSARDLPALQALHADGASAGESPDFFLPSMLDDATYVGVWEGGALVAAAGTHVVARAARAARSATCTCAGTAATAGSGGP